MSTTTRFNDREYVLEDVTISTYSSKLLEGEPGAWYCVVTWVHGNSKLVDRAEADDLTEIVNEVTRIVLERVHHMDDLGKKVR